MDRADRFFADQANQASTFLIPMFRWAVGDVLGDILNDHQQNLDAEIPLAPVHYYFKRLLWVPDNIKEMIGNSQNDNEWENSARHGHLWNGRRGRLPWDFSKEAKIDEWGTEEPFPDESYFDQPPPIDFNDRRHTMKRFIDVLKILIQNSIHKLESGIEEKVDDQKEPVYKLDNNEIVLGRNKSETKKIIQAMFGLKDWFGGIPEEVSVKILDTFRQYLQKEHPDRESGYDYETWDALVQYMIEEKWERGANWLSNNPTATNYKKLPINRPIIPKEWEDDPPEWKDDGKPIVFDCAEYPKGISLQQWEQGPGRRCKACDNQYNERGEFIPPGEGWCYVPQLPRTGQTSGQCKSHAVFKPASGARWNSESWEKAEELVDACNPNFPELARVKQGSKYLTPLNKPPPQCDNLQGDGKDSGDKGHDICYLNPLRLDQESTWRDCLYHNNYIQLITDHGRNVCYPDNSHLDAVEIDEIFPREIPKLPKLEKIDKQIEEMANEYIDAEIAKLKEDREILTDNMTEEEKKGKQTEEDYRKDKRNRFMRPILNLVIAARSGLKMTNHPVNSDKLKKLFEDKIRLEAERAEENSSAAIHKYEKKISKDPEKWSKILSETLYRNRAYGLKQNIEYQLQKNPFAIPTLPSGDLPPPKRYLKPKETDKAPQRYSEPITFGNQNEWDYEFGLEASSNLPPNVDSRYQNYNDDQVVGRNILPLLTAREQVEREGIIYEEDQKNDTYGSFLETLLAPLVPEKKEMWEKWFTNVENKDKTELARDFPLQYQSLDTGMNYAHGARPPHPDEIKHFGPSGILPMDETSSYMMITDGIDDELKRDPNTRVPFSRGPDFKEETGPTAFCPFCRGSVSHPTGDCNSLNHVTGESLDPGCKGSFGYEEELIRLRQRYLKHFLEGGKLTDPLLFEWDYPENYQTKEVYDRLDKKWEPNRQRGEWDEMKQRHENDRKSEEDHRTKMFVRPDINTLDMRTKKLVDHQPPAGEEKEITEYIKSLEKPEDLFDDEQKKNQGAEIHIESRDIYIKEVVRLREELKKRLIAQEAAKKREAKERKAKEREAQSLLRLTKAEADALVVGDYVDHRDSTGKWLLAWVRARNGDQVYVGYKDWKRKWDVWSSLSDELWRFAPAGSFSFKRPFDIAQVNKNEKSNPYSVGAVVQCKPFGLKTWRTGEVVKTDGHQLEVKYMDEQQGIEFKHWVHCHDSNEIRPQ